VVGVVGLSGLVGAPVAFKLRVEGGAEHGGVVGFEERRDAHEPVGLVEQPDAAPAAGLVLGVGAALVVLVLGAPIGAGGAAELPDRQLAGEVEPVGVAVGFGDTGHELDLRRPQLPRPGRGRDGGQLAEPAGGADVSGGGAGVEAELDGGPVADGAEPDAGPPVAVVELDQQLGHLGLRSVDVPGQLTEPPSEERGVERG
jgi:hypothetical protein